MLKTTPLYLGSNGDKCMAIVSDDHIVRDLQPDHEVIGMLSEKGLIVSAQDSSKKYDYIYRYFYPTRDPSEDPVTGSANTSLAPYWAQKLNKTIMG